jgi:hypothetical protein
MKVDVKENELVRMTKNAGRSQKKKKKNEEKAKYVTARPSWPRASGISGISCSRTGVVWKSGVDGHE